SLLLFPRYRSPLAPPCPPEEIQALIQGHFLASPLGVCRTPGGLAFLHWLEDRCRHLAFEEPQQGLHLDQKWLNLAPCLFPDVRIERSLPLFSSPDLPGLLESSAPQPPPPPRLPQFESFEDGSPLASVARKIFAISPKLQSEPHPLAPNSAFLRFCRTHRLLEQDHSPLLPNPLPPHDPLARLTRWGLLSVLRIFGPGKYALLLKYLRFLASPRNQHDVFFPGSPARLPSVPKRPISGRHPASSDLSPSSLPKLGVVSVTYNGAAFLRPFLRDCWKQTHPDFLLYLIDNQSQDETLPLLRAETDPRLRLVESPTNLGFAEGSNVGIRRARAEGCTHILLLNNDVEFPEDLFQTQAEELLRLGAAMIAPKIYYFDSPHLLWSAGGRFGRLWGWTSIHRGEGQPDLGQYERTEPIENAPGCCLLIEASLFDRIGMLDPRYFVYFEDTDFCLRALRAREKFYYTPKTHLFHKVSSSTGGEDSPFSLRMYSRNKAYYLLKHFPCAGWLWILAYLAYILLLALQGKRGGWPHARIRLAQCWKGIRFAFTPQSESAPSS
ncbi:MAG: hypothetical protein RLZZ142_1427, partial [Verrucomicrobiota bacterium]